MSISDIPRSRWVQLVEELGLDPKHVNDRMQLTQDRDGGYLLHLSLVVPVTAGQHAKLIYGEP